MQDVEVRVGFENPATTNPKHLNNICNYLFDEYRILEFKIGYMRDWGYDLHIMVMTCYNGPYLGRYITIQRFGGILELFEMTIDPAPGM